MKKIILMMVLVLSGIFQISAQENDGNPANWCRNGHFPHYKEFYISIIKGKKNERTYFHKDEGKCPKDKNCQTKAYVVAEDQVIVGKEYGDFACVWYQGKKGFETVGWIPKNKLGQIAFVFSKETNLWLGDWRFYDNNLKITKGDKSGTLKIEGEAFWKGMGDNIHYGEIDTQVTFQDKDTLLTIKQDECEVKIRQLVDYLIVADNNQCGGANVTFTGVYRRK